MAMNFDPKRYLIEVHLNEDFLRISDQSYPVNSCNPSGSSRFHGVDQLAYYFASGLPTAKAEVYGSPESGLLPHHHAHGAIPGSYQIFDFNLLLQEHPESQPEYFPGGTQGGWDRCQELRNHLANDLGCSGVLYPSQKHDGGVNTALWPLDGKPLPEQFFRPQS